MFCRPGKKVIISWFMSFYKHSDENHQIGSHKTDAVQDHFIHVYNRFPLLDFFFLLLSLNCFWYIQHWNKFEMTNLVRLVGTQPTAEVCIAPSKRFVPCRRDENFILFYCQNAFISTHDLSHRLLELWKRRWGYGLLLAQTSTIWSH